MKRIWEFFLEVTYMPRLSIANFISGGQLRELWGASETHSVTRQMTGIIASQALQKRTIAEARKFYNEEFKKLEKMHFERMDIVFNLKDRT